MSAVTSTRFRRADSWMVDAAISVALTVALLTDLVDRSGPPWQLLVAAALTSTVAWRRWAPAPAVAVGLVAATLVRDPSQLAQSVVFPLVVVLDYYMLGRRTRGLARLVVACALVLAALPAIWLTPGDSHLVDAASVWLFFFVMPFLAGRALAARDQVNLELAREAHRLEQDVADGRGERSRVSGPGSPGTCTTWSPTTSASWPSKWWRRAV